MVKIRLTRMGKHKAPFYRIVATDSRNKRDGGYLALLGTYEPFTGKTNFKSEEIIKFLNNGAVCSDTVLNLLKAKGLYKTFLLQKPAKKVKTTKKPKVAKKTLAKKSTKKAAKKVAPKVELKTATKVDQPAISEPAKTE